MDPFDVTEKMSLIDENNKVTVIVGDDEEHLEKSKALFVRAWLTEWLREPSSKE